MAEMYYYRILGQEFGPVGLDGLKKVVASGQLGLDDEYREESETDWQPVESFAELANVADGNVEDELPANSSLAESVPDRLRQFYCQSIGQTLGPMLMSDLMDMVRIKELGPRDKVRVGESGEWQDAAKLHELTGLFDRDELEAIEEAPQPAKPRSIILDDVDDVAEPNDPSAPTSDSNDLSDEDTDFDLAGGVAARFENSEASTAAAERQTTEVAENATPSASVAPIVKTPSHSVSVPRPPILRAVEKEPLFNRVRESMMQSPTVLVGMLIVGAYLLWIAVPYVTEAFGTSKQTVFNRLTEIHNELQVRRATGSAAAYAEEVKPELAQIAQDLLESGVGPDTPLKQYLLFCSRDHIPAMLKEPDATDPKHELNFKRDMKFAERLLTGKTVQEATELEMQDEERRAAAE